MAFTLAFACAMTGYAFGDDQPARDRLELLDEVFRASTETLLAGVPAEAARVVLDLGCGVGGTTGSLLRRFPAATVIGLDRSAAMIEAAHERHGQRAEFRVADVARAPLHDTPADVVFARLLLAHLPEPGRAIAAWLDQLALGGVLVLEEIEGIETEDRAFGRHLALVEAVMGEGGTQLRVGARLEEHTPARARVLHDGIARVTPAPTAAARLFSLNLQRLDPHATGLARELAAKAGGAPALPVTWRVRQLVLARETGDSTAGRGAPTARRGAAAVKPSLRAARTTHSARARPARQKSKSDQEYTGCQRSNPRDRATGRTCPTGSTQGRFL